MGGGGVVGWADKRNEAILLAIGFSLLLFCQCAFKFEF